jgi:hypothetical protein
MDESTLIQEKLREYLTLVGPLDRAGAEIELSRKMIRARTEDELHQIAPALGALSEVLGISSIDLLLARDRRAFVQDAVERSGLSIDEVRLRLSDGQSTARDDLKLLGFGESL